MRNINYSIAIVDHTTVYAKMGADQFQTKFIGNRLKQIKQKLEILVIKYIHA